MAVDLVFSETGAGSPLVILHGLFGSKRNWSSIARWLGRRHRVLTVDLRNHGESPWDPCHDYAALADDVARVIETHLGGPAAILGHSMGGKAAMVLAVSRPKLVDRLVVVDIAPARSTGTLINALHAMQAVPLTAGMRRTDVEAALVDAIPDRAVRAFLVSNIRTAPDGLAWAVNLDALARHFDTILGFPEIPPGQRFTGPTLFLLGGRSEYVRPEHHAEIRRLFPAAAIEAIDGAGHWVHAEAPGPFVEAVSRFLAP
jgi:pimeloyl-ACP methyl ester carboxylesterase